MKDHRRRTTNEGPRTTDQQSDLRLILGLCCGLILRPQERCRVPPFRSLNFATRMRSEGCMAAASCSPPDFSSK